MTDRVFVAGLALHAYHGVMQHEAKVGQTFNLDLKLELDLTEASRSDKLAHTVDYDQVVATARRAFCGYLGAVQPCIRSPRQSPGRWTG